MMRKTRAEQVRIALRLPAEVRLEAERLARLSGERNASAYYRAAIAAHNDRVRAELAASPPAPAPASAPASVPHPMARFETGTAGTTRAGTLRARSG